MVVKRGIAVSLPLCAAIPSIAVPEPFSIELTGDSNGVTLMARCTQGSIAKQQLAAHYPGVVIHEVPRIKTPCCSRKANKHGRLPCAWKARSSSHSEPSTTATCLTKAPIH